MLSDLAGQLPLTRHAYGILQASGHRILQNFQIAEGALSVSVSFALMQLATPSWGSEQITLCAVSEIVVNLLLAMDKLLSPSQRIGLILLRDQGDSDSLMTVLSHNGRSLRPDGQLRSKDGMRLICKWEEKGTAHRLSDAVEDLRAKTAVWSPLYYGPLEYLLCFAAAGSTFQFYAIQRGLHSPMPISHVYDMSRISDRAELLVAAVNLYRLLVKVDEVLPRHVLPAGKDLIQKHGQLEYTRSLCALVAPPGFFSNKPLSRDPLKCMLS